MLHYQNNTRVFLIGLTNFFFYFSIILAIMEADSTIVYYEFAEGLQDFQINSDVKQSSLQKARAKQYSNIRKIYSEQTECKENVQ